MPNGSDDDVPKMVASLIVSIPKVTVRTGFAYLRMKRKIRKSSRILMRELIENGVPEESARGLADRYEADLSVRNLFKKFSGDARPDEQPDCGRGIQQTRWMIV